MEAQLPRLRPFLILLRVVGASFRLQALPMPRPNLPPMILLAPS